MCNKVNVRIRVTVSVKLYAPSGMPVLYPKGKTLPVSLIVYRALINVNKHGGSQCAACSSEILYQTTTVSLLTDIFFTDSDTYIMRLYLYTRYALLKLSVGLFMRR